MRVARMPKMSAGNMSDAIWSFLKYVNIFEDYNSKYKSMTYLFYLLRVLISFHEMSVTMMKIVVSFRRKWSEKSIELRSIIIIIIIHSYYSHEYILSMRVSSCKSTFSLFSCFFSGIIDLIYSSTHYSCIVLWF